MRGFSGSIPMIRDAARYRNISTGVVGAWGCLSVVLPVRIELTTSPLPRGCSTTELRQRRAGGGNRETCVGRKSAAILATRARGAQAPPVRAGSRPLLAGPAVVVLAA